MYVISSVLLSLVMLILAVLTWYNPLAAVIGCLLGWFVIWPFVNRRWPT